MREDNGEEFWRPAFRACCRWGRREPMIWLPLLIIKSCNSRPALFGEKPHASAQDRETDVQTPQKDAWRQWNDQEKLHCINLWIWTSVNSPKLCEDVSSYIKRKQIWKLLKSGTGDFWGYAQWNKNAIKSWIGGSFRYSVFDADGKFILFLGSMQMDMISVFKDPLNWCMGLKAKNSQFSFNALWAKSAWSVYFRMWNSCSWNDKNFLDLFFNYLLWGGWPE